MNSNEIRILVLRSHIGGKKCWFDLAKNWQLFGNYKIITVSMMNSSFCYNDLIRIMPDIIVCSDTAGSPSYFTVEESFALKQFVNKIPCRSLFGTYACFYHTEGIGGSIRIFDNRQIAPLFGLSDEMIFSSCKLNDNYLYENEKYNCYINNVIGPKYQINGYNSSKVPKGGSWIKDNKIIGVLPNTKVVYHSNDYKNVILSYKGKYHNSLYVSSMPEFSSQRNNADMKLIYNCLVSLFIDSKMNKLNYLSLKCISEHPTMLYEHLILNKNMNILPSYLQIKVISILNGQISFTKNDISYLLSIGLSAIQNNNLNGSPQRKSSLKSLF